MLSQVDSILFYFGIVGFEIVTVADEQMAFFAAHAKGNQIVRVEF
jgi:hypothetical protein